MRRLLCTYNSVLIPNITPVAEVVGGSELQLTCMPGVGAEARGSQFCINATIQEPGPGQRIIHYDILIVI